MYDIWPVMTATLLADDCCLAAAGCWAAGHCLLMTATLLLVTTAWLLRAVGQLAIVY